MTTTILAHFDGKQALVLDEPADLPVDTPLRVHVEPVETRKDTGRVDDLFAPLIVGLEPELAQSIASDPEFAPENIPQRLPLTMDVRLIRAIVTDPHQPWRPLDVDIDPELGRAIAEDPEFNIEES